MLLLFAGDHAGFEMKQKLLEFVHSLGHEGEDVGPLTYNPQDDYVDFVAPLARLVAEKGRKGNKGRNGEEETGKKGKKGEMGKKGKKGEMGEMGEMGETGKEVRGIIVAGSGQGEIIAVNRVRGVRGALFCPCNLDLIKASREHNDSNIFCIGARFCTLEEAKKGITVWLETPFSSEERHIRRLQKIETL